MFDWVLRLYYKWLTKERTMPQGQKYYIVVVDGRYYKDYILWGLYTVARRSHAKPFATRAEANKVANKHRSLLVHTHVEEI